MKLSTLALRPNSKSQIPTIINAEEILSVK